MLPGKNEMLARYRSPNASCYFLPSCLKQFSFYFCLFHELKLASSVLEAALRVARYSGKHIVTFPIMELNFLENRHEFESQ